MTTTPFIVGLGGTTRVGSTSEKAVRVALDLCARAGAATALFAGPDLPTDVYDPMLAERSAKAVALVEALRRADGIVIATPAYHGGISGLIKNALDYTEDMRADARPYFDGRAVGCIVAAEGAQAMGSTLSSLRAIVHALRGWPTPFAATLNSAQKPFGGPGKDADPGAIQHCELVGQQVLDFARMRQGWR
jgi:FMN reductase